MAKKLDDFLIGPQADEFESDGPPEDFDSDDIVREEYDRRMCEKIDNFHRQKYDEKLREGIENRKLPDVSNILDTSQCDFDYGE